MRASQAVAAGLLSPFGAGFPAGALLGDEPQGAAFDFLNTDMVIRGGGLDWQGDPNSKLTYTSPSTKWVRDASGIYVSGTTLRCDHLADGTALGLLIEGQRTNQVANSTMQGAVDGSSGTIPTGWNTSGGSGLTRTLTTITVNGVECLAWRFSGTTGDTALAISWTTAALVTAASGDTWTNSAFMALTAGAMTNINTFRLALCERTSGGSLVATKYGSDIKGSLTSTLARFTQTSTLDGGGTVARVQPRIEIAYSSGVAVDFTVLIGWPQCELASFASSPIRTTTAAVTRAADDITLATSLIPYSATVGTLIATFRVPSVSGIQTAVSLDDNTDNERITMRASSGSMATSVVDGGVSQAFLSSGTLSANTLMKSAVAWAADDFAYCANGGTVQTDASATLPTMTGLRFGKRSIASDHLFGHLQTIKYLPRRASNSELQAFTA